MDKKETKTFKDGEKTTIANGRDLEITSGGDLVKVKDKRDTTITGNETHHVTGKITQDFDSGQITNIKAGGKTETINDGGLTVNVNGGDWEQNVLDGNITIKTPYEIKLISDKAITLQAPKAKFEPKFHSVSVTAFSESVTGVSTSFTGASNSIAMTSVSFNPASFNITGIKMSNNPVSIHYDNGFKFRVAGCDWDNLTMSIKAAAAFMFI